MMMTALADPDDRSEREILTQPGPHETAGVLRMHRAGMPGPLIAKTLGMSSRQLVDEIRLALEDELEATRKGLPIHDAKITKGTK